MSGLKLEPHTWTQPLVSWEGGSSEGGILSKYSSLLPLFILSAPQGGCGRMTRWKAQGLTGGRYTVR